MSPARLVLAVLVLLALALLVPGSQAQVANVDDTTSTPIEGAGHDYIHSLSETVNPANGSMSLRIQILMPKGRGITIPFGFAYDSNAANHMNFGVYPNFGSIVFATNLDVYSQGGWSTTFPTLRSDAWTKNEATIAGYNNGQPIYNLYPCYYASNYTFRDLSGGVHSTYLGSLTWETSNPPPSGCQWAGGGPASSGGDGQVAATLQTNSQGMVFGGGTLFDDAGNVYYFGSQGTTTNNGTFYGTPNTVEDRNGNILNFSQNTITDTLGRTLISGTSLGAAGTTQTLSVAGGANYQLTWTSTTANYTATSAWAGLSGWPNPPYDTCTPGWHLSGNPNPVVSQISLPNGQLFNFHYGTDNSLSAFQNPYGLLNEIDYPSGAWVRYTYQLGGTNLNNGTVDGMNELMATAGLVYHAASECGGTGFSGGCPYPVPDGCIYHYSTPVVATRTIGLTGSNNPILTQTFSYYTYWAAPANGYVGGTSWTQKVTQVTTADNVTGKSSLTTYTYTPISLGIQPFANTSIAPQSPVESSIQYYDWGNTTTPIRTVNKTWQDNVHLKSQQTVLDTGASSLVNYFYQSDPSGHFLEESEVDEYDFGASSPTRKRLTTYQGLTGTLGILSDRPCKVLTQDGSGNTFAETDLYYDGGTTLCGSTPAPAVTGISGLVSGTHDEIYFASSATTPRGNVTRVTNKCLQSCTDSTATYSYDETGQVLTKTDPCGNATCSDMNVSGETHTTNYSYADSYTVLSNGQNVAYTPTGNTNAYLTKITYATTVTADYTGSHPVQHIENFTYDFNNSQLTASKDQNGQTTSYLYNDPLARPKQISYPDGGQTTISYNDSGPSPSVTTSKKIDTSGRALTTVSVLDGLGHVAQTQLCEDGSPCTQPIKTDTTYDGLGRVWKQSNPHRSTSLSTDGTTTYIYDALGRTCLVVPADAPLPSSAACPTSQPTDTLFTAYSGSTTTVTDEAGKKRQSTTDGLGRLTQVVEDPGGAGYATTYSYDAINNLLGVVQNGSRQRTFSYDSLSRLLTATNPESGSISYSYDANGNLSGRTDARNILTSYGHDALNRNIWKVYSNSDPSVTLVYDQSSVFNGVTVTNPIGHLTGENTGISGTYLTGAAFFGYDQMGRVTSYFQCIPNCSTGWALYYTYDLLGNVTTYTNGLGTTFTQSFDTAGRLSQLTSSLSDPQHPATLAAMDSTVGFWPAGALRKAALGNGLTETAAYNSRLQPCRINVNSTGGYYSQCTDAVPAGNVQDFNYGFNFGVSDNGNVASWSASGTQIFNRSYTPDSLNRLATMSATSDPSGCNGLSWTYDAWGNRTDQTVTSGTCYTFHAAVNTANRLIDPVNNAYKYDAAGNMTQDASHTYFYDGENRVSQVDGTLGTCSTATACYLYDAEGKRVQKITGATQTNYLYNLSGSVIADLDASYATLVNYIYFNGSLLAEYKNGTAYFVHGDHLGSTRLMTAMDQSIHENMDFYPFGEQASGATGTTHKFTGKERDSESGLDHFQFRNFASTMGRWTSPDPINLTAKRLVNPANTLNKYIYGGNNPLLYTDPTGQDITVFYRAPGGGGQDFGHILLAVTNQATGAVRFADYYPKGNKPGFGPAPGEMNQNETADRLKQHAALTIQTSPEVAQKLIDAIDAISPPNGAPDYWLPTSSCVNICTDLLNLAGIDPPSPFATPTDVWSYLYGNYSAEALQGGQLKMGLYRYQAGRDFGNSMSAFPKGTDPFYNLQLLYLLANQQRQKPPRACTTIQGPNGPETNCVD